MTEDVYVFPFRIRCVQALRYCLLFFPLTQGGCGRARTAAEVDVEGVGEHFRLGMQNSL